MNKLKPVLDWVKQNLVIVICGAVILLVLPLSYFFSSGWAADLRKKQESNASSELQKVNASGVDYALPSYDPAVQAISHKGAPNAALIQFFKDARASLRGQADGVAQAAVDFNRGVGPIAKEVGRQPFVPLVEGLFPDARQAATEQLRSEQTPEKFDALTPEDREKLIVTRAGELSRPKLDAMEDALLGKRGRPNPFEGLVTQVRGGKSIDPVGLRDNLRSLEMREKERVTANKRELTPEEQTALRTLLADRRKAEAQAHARSISVFFSLDAINADPKLGSALPRQRLIDPLATQSESVKLGTYFVYQWDLWAYQDLLAAVALANRRSDGRMGGVDESIVKRIESILLKDPEGIFDNVSAESTTGLPPAEPTALIPGLAPLDPTLSITGRGMGSWNKVYDVRRAEMVVVVSSARLNEFLAAIARTNFMTVTDMDLTKVDAWDALRQGYFYGDEHVVRARLTIESVWLRDWMTEFMPRTIRNALEIAEPTLADGGTPPAPSGG